MWLSLWYVITILKMRAESAHIVHFSIHILHCTTILHYLLDRLHNVWQSVHRNSPFLKMEKNKIKIKTGFLLHNVLMVFCFQNCLDLLWAQLPGRLFSPSDISKKLSHHFLMHFPIGMGFYDHHAKYQGVFMDLLSIFFS